MADKYIEKFRKLSTVMLAYMRDVTLTMDHSIQNFTGNAKMIGRAFTVKGPDIYVDALESICEGSVYVHGHTDQSHAVWSGDIAKLYGKPRNLAGVVIDGGIRNRKATAACRIPTFARFVSPLPAINRQKGIIQVAITCGGVSVCPGDIVLGDGDGVLVIPQHNEEEIYNKVDGFLDGMAFFLKLARRAAPGRAITKDKILREMFALKYGHPNDYWRYYEPWAARWRGKCKNRSRTHIA